MKAAVAAAVLILALVSIAAPARAESDVVFIPSTGEHGPELTVRTEPASPMGGDPPVADPGREFELLWHRYLPDPIYTTCGIGGMWGGDVFVGNYLNPPKEVETIPFDGDGTPSWVYPGTEFYADAARTGAIFAAIDCTPADSTIVARAWNSESSAPLWSFPIKPCRPLTAEGWSAGKGVQVSDDGATIAVVVNMYTPAGNRGRLFIFNPGSGTPVTNYPLDGTASAVNMTPDGAFIAIYAWPYIYVYDRWANSLRWRGSAGSGNDAIAISGDGIYIAWGWNVCNVRRWDGATYQAYSSMSYGTTWYVTECAFTEDGRTMAVAWYKNGAFDDNMIEMFGLPGPTLLWTYSYAGGSAKTGDVAAAPGCDALLDPIEVISEMVFSNDMEHLAVASWGQRFPEIHVFEKASPSPVVFYDTPGTMFDIDIVTYVGGDAYITACGKHTHAGISGRGGDVYLIRLRVGSGVGSEVDGSRGLAVSAHPNPFIGRTTIEYTVREPGTVRLGVYDVTGRLVARLFEGFRDAGAHEEVWNGGGHAGRPLAPGAYLVRAMSGGSTGTGRIVLVE